MNSSQKEVQQTHLDEEKKVVRQLKQVYSQAIKDCEAKISALNARTDMQNLQSIIYQKQYQEALESQLSAIMTNLQANEYQNISDYLTGSYTNGYVGAMYDIQKQTGCTVLTPINQGQVVAALQTDSKLSKNLYSRLGEDVTYLKKSVKAELSRGIANGSSWLDIASHIANGMNTPYKKALNNAIRIARTEGHRIQQQSQLDALKAAAEEGADVVKQWDSTLDSRTRPDHREADGQLRELDEKFRVGGEDMEAPGIGGSARNVCNCRCCLLQRAKWALDEDELATLQARAAYYGLDKTSSFDEFKTKYLNLPSNASTINIDNPYNFKRFENTEDRTVVDNLIGCNPNYGSDSFYSVNCQRCVPTLEMRFRGFDVEALPQLGKNESSNGAYYQWQNIFENAVWKKNLGSRNSTVKKNIISEVESWGDGSRGEIYCAWKGGSAHVFMVVNDGGTVMFIDGQTCDTDAEYYFEQMKPSKTMLCRIDNLEPSDLITQCCKNSGE